MLLENSLSSTHIIHVTLVLIFCWNLLIFARDLPTLCDTTVDSFHSSFLVWASRKNDQAFPVRPKQKGTVCVCCLFCNVLQCHTQHTAAVARWQWWNLSLFCSFSNSAMWHCHAVASLFNCNALLWCIQCTSNHHPCLKRVLWEPSSLYLSLHCSTFWLNAVNAS